MSRLLAGSLAGLDLRKLRKRLVTCLRLLMQRHELVVLLLECQACGHGPHRSPPTTATPVMPM